MKTEKLDMLFAKARAYEPDLSAVEYGFETRVMARVRAEKEKERHVSLFNLAWRMLPVFTALVVGMGIWSYTYIPEAPFDLVAAVNAEYDHTMAINFFNGDQS